MRYDSPKSIVNEMNDEMNDDDILGLLFFWNFYML